MSFPSGVCVQRNRSACCHGQSLCCTIIESLVCYCLEMGPRCLDCRPMTAPVVLGGPVRGPFLGGRLLSSKQPTASGRDQMGTTHQGTAKPQSSRSCRTAARCTTHCGSYTSSSNCRSAAFRPGPFSKPLGPAQLSPMPEHEPPSKLRLAPPVFSLPVHPDQPDQPDRPPSLILSRLEVCTCTCNCLVAVAAQLSSISQSISQPPTGTDCPARSTPART